MNILEARIANQTHPVRMLPDGHWWPVNQLRLAVVPLEKYLVAEWEVEVEQDDPMDEDDDEDDFDDWEDDGAHGQSPRTYFED